MFGVFKKRRSQEEIENEISDAIGKIMKDNPCGKRDFSKLLLLDKELIENKSFVPILAMAFEILVKQTENAFFCNVDIQIVLDYLRDLSTFPDRAESGYAKIWLEHEKLFEQKPQRYMSVLDTKRSIEEQFKEIKENTDIYHKDFVMIMDICRKATEKFQKRDDYDKSELEGAYERFSILTDLMLGRVSEKKILSARKVLLAYALNADEDSVYCYNLCKKHFYGKYINLIREDQISVPAVDVIIGNAILKSEGIFDEDAEKEFLHDIEIFNETFDSVEEMKEQKELYLKVMKYLEKKEG